MRPYKLILKSADGSETLHEDTSELAPHIAVWNGGHFVRMSLSDKVVIYNRATVLNLETA